MNTQICLRHIESEPTLAYVIMHKTWFVPNKCTDLLGIRSVEQTMHSLNHLKALSIVSILYHNELDALHLLFSLKRFRHARDLLPLTLDEEKFYAVSMADLVVYVRLHDVFTLMLQFR